MSNISSLSSSMHLASGSLRTHSVGMQVTAHNVANISTDGFDPQRATFATGANGNGVELESVRKIASASSAYPGPNGLGISGTDIAREFTEMINIQRGFQANAATIRTADQMSGYLLDIIA